jgi:hypothetical protein
MYVTTKKKKKIVQGRAIHVTDRIRCSCTSNLQKTVVMNKQSVTVIVLIKVYLFRVSCCDSS